MVSIGIVICVQAKDNQSLLTNKFNNNMNNLCSVNVHILIFAFHVKKSSDDDYKLTF